MAIEVPGVTVEQIFEVQNPDLTPPTLPSVIIGTNRQIEFQKLGGEYDTNPISIPYPGLKLNAVVDISTVKVFFSNTDGLFEIDDFTADADSVDIDGDIVLDVRKIENSQTGVSKGIFFTDDDINFFQKFDLTNTPTIVISSPSDNAKVYLVDDIITANKIRLHEKEDGIIRSNDNFESTFLSTATVFSHFGDSTTNPISVREYILGGNVTTIAFTSTYSIGADTIDNENSVNAETDIITGDKIWIDGGTEEKLHEVIKINNDGSIKINPTLGETVTLSNFYKIYHPVFIRNQVLNNSGDFVIAFQTVATNRLFTAEVNSIIGLNTISTVAALTDIDGNLATSGWNGGADTYQINRGVLKNSENNVYDGFEAKSSFSASILVSFQALRKDLNDDTHAITGFEDIANLLGPAVPDNPLALAAIQHNAVSDNLFFVIGLDGDTLTGHQKALEILESKEVYSLVPLTQNLNVIPAYSSHVTNMSKKEEKKERIAFVNRDIFISDDIIIGNSSNLMRGGTSSIPTEYILGLANQGTFLNSFNSSSVDQGGVGFGVNVGDRFLVFQGNDQTTISTAADVLSVSDDLSSITLDATFLYTSGNSFQILSNTTTSGIVGNNGSLTTVSVGDAVNLLDKNSDIDIASVVTSKPTDTERQILIVDTSFGQSLSDQTFSATTFPLSKLEQAQFLRDYSASIKNRRIVNVHAPEAKITFTTVEDSTVESSEFLPGYFLAAGVGGMKSENRPSQPFTNLPLNINTELKFSNTYFKPTFLDVIADGGTYILVQDTVESFPFSRHQLTTDATSIQTRELSITTAIDFFAKFLRTRLVPFIGRFNITDNYLAQVKAVAQAAARKTVFDFRDLRDIKIRKIEQDVDQPDTVKMDLDILPLFPANFIRVRLFI